MAMQPQVPMVQQAPMAMIPSGQQGWAPQQPQNGNHGGPQQIMHQIGTTPVMPEQQPAQNAGNNKAAPGRLQNKSKGIMNRPKGPTPELTNEAPEQADKGGTWGQSRKKLVNATMAHGPAEQSTDGRNAKISSQPSSHPATPAETFIAPRPEPTPAASVAASQPPAQAKQTSAQPKKEDAEEKPAQDEEPKKPEQMSWADRVRAGAAKKS